jgi:transposase
MNNGITYVGIDAHKETLQLAIKVGGEERLEEWTIRNRRREVQKVARKIKRMAPGQISACYEAGPCGFVLQRWLEAEDVPCIVVAPSLIPKQPGNRVKTDSRDAQQLVLLLRAGLLTEVTPPTPEQEDLRDLTRCRSTMKEELMAARHHLLKFLSRRGFAYDEGDHWTQKHRRWLKSLRFEGYAETVFREYLMEIEHLESRVEALDQELEKVAQDEKYREVVGCLRCMRGIDTVTAVSLVAELFQIMRFASPRELMSYLGLTPSMHNSGGSERSGPITKAGNRYARRLLIESAWHNRHQPRVGKNLKARRKDQPAWAVEIADRAMTRLHKRYRHLIAHGKKPSVATTAVARELVGFVWDILHTHTCRKQEKQPSTGGRWKEVTKSKKQKPA